MTIEHYIHLAQAASEVATQAQAAKDEAMRQRRTAPQRLHAAAAALKVHRAMERAAWIEAARARLDDVLAPTDPQHIAQWALAEGRAVDRLGNDLLSTEAARAMAMGEEWPLLKLQHYWTEAERFRRDNA